MKEVDKRNVQCSVDGVAPNMVFSFAASRSRKSEDPGRYVCVLPKGRRYV